MVSLGRILVVSAHIVSNDIYDHRERYLTASTYLSSRAFPSTILSQNPSLQTTESSHPILLPGIDSINHAPGTAVSWVVGPSGNVPSPAPISPPITPSSPRGSDLAVSLVLHFSTKAGKEIFNNYGPKPNSELILGYGFALFPNPSDTIVLQIGVGGTKTSQGERKKFEIGKNASGADLIWNEILILDAPNSGAGEKTYEDYLSAAEKLGDMLFRLLDNLPKIRPIELHEALRSSSEPQEMLGYYVEGSCEPLASTGVLRPTFVW
jgi:hypothetical protein